MSSVGDQYQKRIEQYIYVMRKVWICAIHGLFAQQSMDLLRIPWIAPRYFAQSMDQADEVLFHFEVTS